MLGFLFQPYRTTFYSGGGVTATDVSIASEKVSQELSRRIESLELACAGLWELLKAKHSYTDEELIAAVRGVDLKDGKQDGRVLVTDAKCPQCGRHLLSRKSPNCSWCGADLGRAPL